MSFDFKPYQLATLAAAAALPSMSYGPRPRPKLRKKSPKERAKRKAVKAARRKNRKGARR